MSWQIERLGHLGDGIAHDGTGAQILAARTLPGEVIAGEPVDGRILNPKIILSAPERIHAQCPHYTSCGGCALMHARDDFVAGWKVARVQSAFAAHGIDAEIAGMATSPERSRRRAVFSGRKTKSGAMIGFHGRASGTIVDVRDCRVIRPRIQAALPTLRAMIVAGAARGAELGFSVTESATGLDVMVSGGKPADAALTELLTGMMGQADIARLGWGEVILTRIAPEIRMGSARVTPPPGGFLQATAEGEAALLAVVRAGIGKAARIVDLFAGSGTFTLPLAKSTQIHAVEGLSAQLASLDAAWRNTPGLRRVTTERRDLGARPLQPSALAQFDAAIVDPPRSGAPAQAAQIAASRLGRVAWVSCDPVTFARDARILIGAGYRMDPIHVVDQFRWSTHVETVTVFRRDDSVQTSKSTRV